MTQFESDYQEALDYLYSFVDYSLTRNLAFSPEKFDLIRMVALVEKLGNPQNQYPIIHVAGTKGKGSTAALCAAALRAEGYRVGFYTSPHLSDFTERIQVNGESISHADLVGLVDDLKPHVAAIERLTTFELTTALAFLYFMQRKVDFAVIEVGLGGRLDATNVVTPLISVITSLSYDHMAILGNTLTEIASEKAGIIKAGKPVVLAPQQEEARLAVEKVALERGSRLVEVGKEYRFAALSHTLRKQTFLVWQRSDQDLADQFLLKGLRKNKKLKRLSIPLLGQHQIENAATAFAALNVARDLGVKVSDRAMAKGFAEVEWLGRFEILRRQPVVVIDSAHNRDSAWRLRQTMEAYLPGKPVVLLFAASEDKDIKGMLTELLPVTTQVVVTQTEHPRAMGASQLASAVNDLSVSCYIETDVERAFNQALSLAKKDKVVLVTGSIFLVAAVRDIWMRRSTNEIR